MSSKRKTFQVTRGNSFLTVYPWKHAKTGARRWRFAWRKLETDPFRYRTCKTQAEAEQAAWELLGELNVGGLVWAELDPDAKRFHEDVHRLTAPEDREAVISFLKGRKKSAEIGLSVGRFMDWKIESAGEETRHLSNVRRDLEAMAESFRGCSLLDITPGDLKSWWDKRVEGRKDKTRNEVRGNLVGFWNWAVWDGIYPKEVTPAEKLPRVEIGHGERRVLTVDEVIEVLRKVDPRWRAWVVLGAFCGLRPEEIAPPRKKGMSKKDKRGIRHEEIDFRFKVIHLPAEVSKVDTPRKVPLCDAALTWLAWAGVEEGQTGPVCIDNPVEKEETARLGKEVFKTGWPQDALRHSYGSYRNAMIRNLPQVAEEMGTSEAMLRRHYHNPKTLEEGTAWFDVRPEVIRCDPRESTLNKKPGKTRIA